MLDKPSNETIRMLADLRAKFQPGLNDRICEICDDFKSASNSKEVEHARDFLTKIKHAAHKLSGSSGINGRPDISVVATANEQACHGAIENASKTIPDSGRKARIVCSTLFFHASHCVPWSDHNLR